MRRLLLLTLLCILTMVACMQRAYGHDRYVRVWIGRPMPQPVRYMYIPCHEYTPPVVYRYYPRHYYYYYEPEPTLRYYYLRRRRY